MDKEARNMIDELLIDYMILLAYVKTLQGALLALAEQKLTKEEYHAFASDFFTNLGIQGNNMLNGIDELLFSNGTNRIFRERFEMEDYVHRMRKMFDLQDG
jgi:hypothetical protein